MLIAKTWYPSLLFLLLKLSVSLCLGEEEKDYHWEVLGLGACQWNKAYLGKFFIEFLRYSWPFSLQDVVRLIKVFWKTGLWFFSCESMCSFLCVVTLTRSFGWLMQLRSSKEVSKEDYNTFYKSTFKEFIDPQAYTHFSTEVSEELGTFFRCSVVYSNPRKTLGRAFGLKILLASSSLQVCEHLAHGNCSTMVAGRNWVQEFIIYSRNGPL